jgi:flavin reductase (DIM6/NTAB) family NADH-FMN oxidoreductase RutF
LETREVVINTVSYAMVEQVSLASFEFPRGVNEFLKAGLTEVKSEMVKPPRVKESPVSFECKVWEESFSSMLSTLFLTIKEKSILGRLIT